MFSFQTIFVDISFSLDEIFELLRFNKESTGYIFIE